MAGDLIDAEDLDERQDEKHRLPPLCSEAEARCQQTWRISIETDYTIECPAGVGSGRWPSIPSRQISFLG